MKHLILQHLLVASLFFLYVTSASADTFALASGESHQGKIEKIFDGQLTLSTGGGETVSFALSDLDAASQAAANSWADSHPEAVDVYTKWDAQPVIKSSSMPKLPNQFREPAFKGMVSVELVLDEKGKVIFAKVQKSTHAGLEAASVEAAKTWRFAPAKVGGKTVKAKLRVPFKFTYDS